VFRPWFSGRFPRVWRALPERLRPGRRPDQQRHHDVLEGGELRQQVVNLPNEPNLPAAKTRSFGVGERGNLFRAKTRWRRLWAGPGPQQVRRVDLPAPDSPTRASRSPCPISRFRPSNTTSSPAPERYFLLSPVAVWQCSAAFDPLIPTLARQSSHALRVWDKAQPSGVSSVFPRTPAGLRLLTCIDAEGRTDVAGSRDAREPLGRATDPRRGFQGRRCRGLARRGNRSPRRVPEPKIAELWGIGASWPRPEISLVSKPGVVERFLLHSRPRDDKTFF